MVSCWFLSLRIKHWATAFMLIGFGRLVGFSASDWYYWWVSATTGKQYYWWLLMIYDSCWMIVDWVIFLVSTCCIAGEWVLWCFVQLEYQRQQLLQERQQFHLEQIRAAEYRARQIAMTQLAAEQRQHAPTSCPDQGQKIFKNICKCICLSVYNVEGCLHICHFFIICIKLNLTACTARVERESASFTFVYVVNALVYSLFKI